MIKMIDNIDNSNINIYSTFIQFYTILYKNLICYKNVLSKLFLARKNTVFKYIWVKIIFSVDNSFNFFCRYFLLDKLD